MTTDEYRTFLKLQSKQLRTSQRAKQLELIIAVLIVLYVSTTLVLLTHYN